VGVCLFAGFSDIWFFQEFINQVCVAEVGGLITGELAPTLALNKGDRMKSIFMLLILSLGIFSGCNIFNKDNKTFEIKIGYDSLSILAQKDTMNLHIYRRFHGLDSIFIRKDTNSLLGDTIRLFYHISGETVVNTDTIVTNFYFQNDTFHIYTGYEIEIRDSLSKNFQVLRKSENTPAPSYANIDSLFIFYSANKYVNTTYDIW
jgi:hypothetical protein